MIPIYLLDTNIVSVLVLGRSASAAARFRGLRPAQVRVSAITRGEMAYGLSRRADPARLREAISRFFAEVEVLPWDREVADRYGQLRAELEQSGAALGALDMQIAAHALHAGAILVTADKAFARVPGLKVEDWTR
jgi:tRNA(fMet)-specific endonuclease VapC